jgi:hypothetical protein
MVTDPGQPSGTRLAPLEPKQQARRIQMGPRRLPEQRDAKQENQQAADPNPPAPAGARRGVYLTTVTLHGA